MPIKTTDGGRNPASVGFLVAAVAALFLAVTLTRPRRIKTLPAFGFGLGGFEEQLFGSPDEIAAYLAGTQ